MKKTIALLVALIIMCGTLFTIPAVAEEGFEFALKNSGADPVRGENVTLTLELKQNKGVAMLLITPVYDKEAFTLVSVTNGMSGFNFTGGPKLPNQVWLDPAGENNNDTGILATYVFKVNDAAKLGDNNIEMKLNEYVDADGTKTNPGTVVASISVHVNCAHDFSEKDTSDEYIKSPATCTVKAKYYYKCSICGAKGEQTFEAGELKKHNYGGWRNSESKHWHECSDCNAKADEADHSWDNGVTVIEATEDAGGQKKFTCDVCGAIKLVDTEKLPHTHDYGEEWKSNDAKHWHECSKCHEKKDEADHSWDNGVTVVEATEDAGGQKKFTCDVCGATKLVDTEKLPHTHDYGEEWKSNDTKHWHECSKCHEKKDEADHKWDNGKVTKEPTEEADGEKLFTCSDCKATKTEKIEKLPTPPQTGLPVGIVITAILAAVIVVAFSLRKRKQYKTEG